MDTLRKIWSLLGKKERIILGFLSIAVVVNSVLEMFGIGMILPIMALVSNPDNLGKYPIIQNVTNLLGIADNRHVLLYLVIFYVFVFIFKNIYLTKLTVYQAKFTANMLHGISTRLLRTYLFSPWSFHVKSNSADILNNTMSQSNSLCTGLIDSAFLVCTESFVVLSIFMLMLIVNPLVTLFSVIVLGGATFLFLFLTHKKQEYLGEQSKRLNGQMIKAINEALGGIKESKVLGREEHFVKTYSNSQSEFKGVWVNITLLRILQRSMIEVLVVGGMMITVIVALIVGGDIQYLMSILAMLAVASFRLMPSMNRISAAFSTIKCYLPALNAVHKDINLIIEDKYSRASENIMDSRIKLVREIELKEVSFKYPGTKKNVLDSISMVIPKGCSAGFMGRSGAGKTTAVDIILGLLRPDSGAVMFDGVNINNDLRGWQTLIGYIPQTIYLSDDTIRKNIAFGLDDEQISDLMVWNALNNAHLGDFIRSLPEGLDTVVGERGVRISGGQRQRIGIARAIYHDPQILIMDEATSSLDSRTEQEISEAFFKLSGEKTLIIIAHRLSTIERCDILYEFKNGKAHKRNSVSDYQKGLAVNENIATDRVFL